MGDGSLTSPAQESTAQVLQPRIAAAPTCLQLDLPSSCVAFMLHVDMRRLTLEFSDRILLN
jgi:hypothetical protein